MYDVLEVAAMKRRTLTLTINGKEMTVLVNDVYARGKEEFLDGTDSVSGKPIRLRLDSIQRLHDHADGKTYIPQHC